MFFKRNKKYSLNDIQKLFSQIPVFFIMLLAFLLFVISFFIIESKENRKIDLLKQKTLLNYEFNKKEQLERFKNKVKENLKDAFLEEEILLKKVTYKVIGYFESNSLSKIYDIEKYIESIEKHNNTKIVVFEKVKLNILHGKDSINYLQKLVFNTKVQEKNKDIILKYIYSQGEDNLQYWKDDLERTVRLSFFDRVSIDKKEYFIGSFSTINSIKEITRKSILNTINTNNYNIWFYDIISQNTYNFKNNKAFKHSNELLLEKKENTSFKILEHYFMDYEYSEKFKNLTYMYEKHNFLISTFYDRNIIDNEIKDLVFEIKREYRNLLFQIFIYILVVTAILILFTYVFSNFIKNIFNEYNHELQSKTVSLEHWKKRFELAIIASNDGLWDIDFKTEKIYFSNKWLEMFGYKKEEVKTFSDWFELIHNEDKANVKNLFDKIFAKDDDTFICEYRLKTKNEGFKWVLARGKAFITEDNEFGRMLMMSMDIDKNKRMKKELLDVELLVEDGKIVIFKLTNDKNLSIKYISNSIKTFGYTKQEFESNYTSLMSLIYKDDINKVQVAINAALKNDLPNFTIVCRVINAANEIRWISSRVILIKNHSGEVSHFYGYINDITKIKVSQEELKLKVEDEVKKNRDKDRILIQQSKLASMGEMLGNIAHQWRQPLNNVSLILQFLRDNYKNEAVSSEKLDKFMYRANTHIEYMSETIDDFKNFYKPSKTQNEFCIKECINTLLHMVKNQYESEDIKIEFNSNNLIITNYENELKQAILNILNNAKDALLTKISKMSKEEKNKFEALIKISLIQEDKNIRIEILNNGGNINDEIIDRIFEPYFTTKFEHQGTGIGLYMTKSIIETNMKGKIEVLNINDGVKFIITLSI
ncbi:PAS domain-containing protein [Poseidonibacter lekithochrous]|uniref:PAS domain-containing sensor histidine kinase n=1 Tax=Poseidonibacter TaxID=2321187 RepID=UPI001C09FB2A|nr:MULTISPECIES: PAS domain-containing sensor histidine kinase [Poseidonibacter]MBU3015993.1 PAS domain-containing protein [Poseidonibacter lekithochrous]MDO6829292.1 PAS domain-containing protein [Poseidonibacter sp. 1_MG-2023]